MLADVIPAVSTGPGLDLNLTESAEAVLSNNRYAGSLDQGTDPLIGRFQ